ncbi:Rho-binding antiterminator [Pseudoalteromonas spongiae]|uniref:Rho-binding antiterminator n=1 Tax=Pseudoalteromonas spongiae TaxID=298657 RepID=A0ABU8ES01_9GAMM
MAKLISCGLYDYFEIVCMRNSEVVVSLKNKQQFSGIAKALIHENGTELLSLMQSDHH